MISTKAISAAASLRQRPVLSPWRICHLVVQHTGDIKVKSLLCLVPFVRHALLMYRF